MKKGIFMTALLCAVFLTSNAQKLNIGDIVPDINIGKIINFSSENLKFSAIKSRLVILDYWATNCAPCISGLPKMDSLQKKFGDQILILPATHQDEMIIRAFWSKSKYTNTTSLPTIVNDTLRSKYFRGSDVYVPFEVWILDGKIFAFTGPDKVNEKEIRDVITGKQKDWAMAPSGLAMYDKNPLLQIRQDGNYRAGSVFYTTLAGAKTNVYPAFGSNFREKNRNNSRLWVINLSILDLYRTAYNLKGIDPGLFNKNKTILEVSDQSKYYSLDKYTAPEWNRDNSYCYEAILPVSVSEKEMGLNMKADLDKFLDLTTSIEKRKTVCWVLTLKPGIKKIKNNLSQDYLAAERKFNDPKTTLDERREIENDRQYKMNRVDLRFTSTRTIVEGINARNSSHKTNPPLLDETNYKNEFDISILIPTNYVLPEFEELKAELDKHGFELKKDTREIEMFVLRENSLKKN